MEVNPMSQDIQIGAQATPNPETLKFVVNRQFLLSGSLDFSRKELAKDSPLAKALFEIKDVRGVFIGTNFVTITKAPDTSWSELAKPCVDTLGSVLKSEQDPVGRLEAAASTGQVTGGEEDPDVIKIKEVLDREIRPAVAADGGDIVFHGYKDGVLTLHLQGACSSCPSATLTLKMGVETRLKSLFPEIKEVVQI